MSGRMQHTEPRLAKLLLVVVAESRERKRDVGGFVKTVGRADKRRQLTAA